MAQAAKWPAENWAVHLVPLLDGKAQAAYEAKDGDEMGDYSKGNLEEVQNKQGDLQAKIQRLHSSR